MPIVHQLINEVTAQALHEGKSLRLRVRGASMAPLLLPGDLLLAESTLPETLTPGDLVIIRQGSGLVTHRLISKEVDGWITKGDRSLISDGFVRLDRILGKAVQAERGERILNLQKPSWRRANRWLAGLGAWEIRIYGWSTKHFPRWNPLFIAQLLAFPLRIARYIIVGMG